MDNLKLVKSEKFGSVQCDFWKGKEDKYWFTRKQIGEALEYADPQWAIDRIHKEHSVRLDKFSTTTELKVVEGNRTVKRKVILYNHKGLYEVCRWSQQPKADVFMDWVWNILDGIRKSELTIQICREVRKELTDAIKGSTLEEKYHQWAYKLITDYTYKLTIGQDAKHYRAEHGLAKTANVRNHLPEYQRKLVAMVEDAVKALIMFGYDYEEIKKTVSDKFNKQLEAKQPIILNPFIQVLPLEQDSVSITYTDNSGTTAINLQTLN